jgi:hypothetical protein
MSLRHKAFSGDQSQINIKYLDAGQNGPIIQPVFELFRAIPTKWQPTIQIPDHSINGQRPFGQNGNHLCSLVHSVQF